MRIRTFQPQDSHHPYNAVFYGFGESFYTKLFERRRRIESFENEYVQNGIERYLGHFTHAKSRDIGLLVGPPGIGKSTTLEYMRTKVWHGMDCLVVLNDCSRHTMDLPKAIFESTDAREREASTLANSVLKQLLIKHAVKLQRLKNGTASNTTAFTEEDWKDLFAFMGRLDDVAFPDSWFLSENRSQAGAELMKREDGLAFAKMLFSKAVFDSGISHVKILLDNLDDKNSAVIEALIENTAHVVEDLSKVSFIDGSKPPAYSVIVACRTATAQLLKNTNNRPGHEWYTLHAIPIVKCVPLTRLLVKRYNVLCESKEFRDDNPIDVSSGNYLWRFESRTAFFTSLCQSLEDSQQGDEFAEIANYSLRDALSFAGEVLRNRHFVDINKLIAEYFQHEGRVPPPQLEAFVDPYVVAGKQGQVYAGKVAINKTNVIKCLAYGNQGITNEPVYPVSGTAIPNILECKPHSLFSTSIAKPRLVHRLVRRSTDGGNGAIDCLELRIITEELVKWFGRTPAEATLIIDELHSNRLLENMDSERRPSETGDNCRVRATPRAIRMWNHLRSDSVLLQLYRDDCCLRTDLASRLSIPTSPWILRPSQSINLPAQIQQCTMLCSQCFVVEKEQIEASIKSMDALQEYLACYSDELLTHSLMSGVAGSWDRFYRQKTGSTAPEYQPLVLLQKVVEEWWNEFRESFK